MSLLALPPLFLACAAIVPEDSIAPEWALPLATVAALAGVVTGGVLARHIVPRLRVHGIVLTALLLFKLTLAFFIWDTFYYSLDGQVVRPAFASSEIYYERASDTAVIDELLALYREVGVSYYGTFEADLSINNRPPAHLAALVVRAFGGQYAAYFPFVGMVAALASMAMLAAVRARASAENQLIGKLLAIGWPLGWFIGTMMKDPLLYGWATLLAAYLSLSDQEEGAGIGLALATATLPLFRVAYAIPCFVVLAIWLTRSRTAVPLKWIGVASVVVLVAWLVPWLDVSQRFEDYRAMSPSDSPILAVPVVGPLVYGLATPFPWTQAFEGWWKFQYVFYAATGTIMVGLLVALAANIGDLRRRVDYGALLALALMVSGLSSRYIAFGYVQVGACGLLPLAVSVEARVRRYLLLSLAAFVAANLLWLFVRT